MPEKDEPRERLAGGVMPERYKRNLGTVGLEGQQKLLQAKVVVIGAGGLGGTIIELLARLGVGYIRVVDGDCFAAHNLNRQLLAEEHNLGGNKAEAAATRVRNINSEVIVEPHPVMLDESNAHELLAGVDIVVDALDNIKTRRLLAAAAENNGLPLVHAAIAGLTGQVMTILPGDRSFKRLYNDQAPERGVELTLGNPAPTPALAATLQVGEVMKLITGKGELLRNKMLYFDLEFNIFQLIDFG